MARRRRKRKSASAGKCRVVRVKGQGLRRICWRKNGKIKSNTKASSGGRRRRRRSRR